MTAKTTSSAVSVAAMDAPDAAERMARFGLEVFGAEMEVPREVPLHRGTAAVFSESHPEKSAPNEDSAALIPIGESRAVLVVADGVGGLPNGSDASFTAISALREALVDAADPDVSLRTSILNGVELANHRVLELGVGAATTIAVAALDGDHLRTYHVGDSMILLVGQRGKRKLETISHSPVGYAVEAGVLDEREAVTHVERHVVSNILGSPEMRIDVGPRCAIAPRDTLVIATDGLFDNLFVDEIIEIIRMGPLEAGACRLVAKCRARMRGESAAPRKPDDLTLLTYRPRRRRST